ncbi:hypothetical protein [Halosegnis longus]|uniref:hypothetical protein n=1 Tax=Halosegnis longus TaxID=2216012 RepID=UPI00129D7D16|nr:hypothetical protein [Halosegnis longus]
MTDIIDIDETLVTLIEDLLGDGGHRFRFGDQEEAAGFMHWLGSLDGWTLHLECIPRTVHDLPEVKCWDVTVRSIMYNRDDGNWYSEDISETPSIDFRVTSMDDFGGEINE